MWLLGLAFATSGHANTVTILPLGDSITEGYGLQCSYRRPLVQMLFEDYGCPVTFAGSRLTPSYDSAHCRPTNTPHEGRSAKTVNDQIPPMETAMNSQQVDYVLVHLGSNDMFYGDSTETIITDLELLIDSAKTINPNVTILLAAVIPWDPSFPGVGLDAGHLDELQLSNDLAAAIAQLVSDRGDDKLLFVDANTDFDSKTMTYDGIHPNNLGEEFLAGRFLSVLNTLGVCANPTVQTAFSARVKNADNGMCIEMPQASTAAGALAGTDSCADVAHQWLSFDPVSTLDNTYTIQFQHSQASNLCLDASGGALAQEICNDSSDQQFRIDVEATRYLISVNGLPAELSGNGQIAFSADNGALDQRWQFDGFLSGAAAELCDPDVSRRLISNPGGWHLLSLPCTVPNGTTMADLIDGAALDSDEWSAFRYQANGSPAAYIPIAAGDPAPAPGVGFWFNSAEEVTLKMPAGSLKVQGTNALPCAAGMPCHLQSIAAQSTWNLMGNPSDSNLRYEDILVVNESTTCRGSSPCALDNLPDVDTSFFVFNGVSYQQFAGAADKQRLVMPWEAYWTNFRPVAGSGLSIDDPWEVYLREYPGQFMFVTNGNYAGDFGGLQGADEHCQSEATLAGLPGEYRAWLSDGATSPNSRWVQHNTPYLGTDGQIIAADYADLTDGILLSAIDKTAGRVDKLPMDVWANTSTTGDSSSAIAHCDQWSTMAGRAGVGRTDRTDKRWTGGSYTRGCGIELPLYCGRQ